MYACEGDMYTPSQALRSCWHTMKEEESGTVDTQFSHMEDDALLQHIRHGKHEAFEALVTRHARRFYGTALRDLFRWLLEHLSLPARPRTVRRSA